MTSNALVALTHEKWEKAKSVLQGTNGEKVSMTAAAREAGVTLGALNAWVRRSREHRISDEPWIHEIAEVVDQRGIQQGDTLEDLAWERAMGVEKKVWHRGEVVGKDKVWDNKVMMTLLGARKEEYRPDKNKVTVLLDSAEILMKMQALVRLARADEELKGNVYDGKADSVTETPGMEFKTVKPVVLPDDDDEVEI